MKRILTLCAVIMATLAAVSSCSSGIPQNSEAAVQLSQASSEEPGDSVEESQAARGLATTALSKVNNLSSTLMQTAHAEMTYQTTSVAGIASVSDTIVIGTFENVESQVEDIAHKSIVTKGTLKPLEVLAGQPQETYNVSMLGGTVPYESIAELYTPEELAKYKIDPETTKYETLSYSFEGMVPFEEGKTYIVTLSESNGTYSVQPSIYSLCELVDDPAAAPRQTETSVTFKIDEYVAAFKASKG